MPEEQDNVYARFWDHYVDSDWEQVRAERGDVEWPGDEWGGPKLWEGIFNRLFLPAGVASWRRAVEIGPGSGKYALKVLAAAPEVQVRAYDVSQRFLEVCAERCASEIARERLSLQLLDVAAPDHMLSDLSTRGWRREVDGFYSIDVMVHVDLQYLIAYLLTAALALKPGGKLVLTAANATSGLGFSNLMRGIKTYWQAQADPIGSSKMEWVDRSMMESILPRLGFELELLHDPQKRWWLELVASLERPEVADELGQYLCD